MMTQQKPQTTEIAPGDPIGYAPVYAPPPLASANAATSSPTPSNANRWIDGFIVGGLIGSAVFALTTWGVLDNLYSGQDIRALERAAESANVSAINAEANAQAWQAHAAQQGQTIDGVRELICR